MKPIIIDVREPYEFADGHVEGATNLPLSELMAGTAVLTDIPKDAALLLYCRSGSRVSTAIPILQKLGYTNLTNGINQQHVDELIASA